MEATRKNEIETITGGKKTGMSNARMVFIGAMVLAAFYVVWGIFKVIS